MIFFVEFCGYDFLTTQESGVRDQDPGLLKKMNIEHRTSGLLHGYIEFIMRKDERHLSKPCSALNVCFSFDAGRSMFDLHLLKHPVNPVR